MPPITEAYIRRKAAQLRSALLEAGVTHSPDPDMLFEDLPAHRQERWIKVARVYVETFCS